MVWWEVVFLMYFLLRIKIHAAKGAVSILGDSRKKTT